VGIGDERGGFRGGRAEGGKGGGSGRRSPAMDRGAGNSTISSTASLKNRKKRGRRDFTRA